MAIRFFATNRDQHLLGRDVNRETRIQLQTGGYYWIDTRGYMSHYLATTDSSEMPASAILANSKDDLFRKFLNRPAVKRVIIGIHGFNVPMHGAITSFSLLADMLKRTSGLGPTLVTDPVLKVVRDPRTNQIEKLITDWDDPDLSDDDRRDSRIQRTNDDLRRAGNLDDPFGNITAFIGFSWPSNGKLLDYQSDRADAGLSAPVLGNLIARIREQNPALKVHIVAHSMGNYMACHTLSGLVDKQFSPLLKSESSEISRQISRRDQGGSNDFFVDRFIMLAPDVERREVTKSEAGASGTNYIGTFYDGLKHVVDQTHLFYSRFDNALQASVIEKEARETLQKAKELLTGPDLAKRWESSLGLNPLPALAPANMYDHNGVTLTNRKLDHGDYFDALDIGNEISRIIMSAS